ncbi:5877_t:CDS:2 [Ambispora leptoticha]|uniref:5877_t:CDS:1 n=1 Tax=Ambispora leptoticha TaxID=144679 RepID=A0A9N9HKT3_9GLOM|nr:5877_t:CDS:2 [Ambispora leptoticha]
MLKQNSHSKNQAGESELSSYDQGYSADEIHQILKMTDFYDEEEDIDLDQVMLNMNLERSNIDDDSKILEDQVLKLQDMINLDIPHLNQSIGNETNVKNSQEDNNKLDK